MGPAFSELSKASGFIDAVSAPDQGVFASDAFDRAETCGSCHPQHYAEWQNTAHAHAMSDVVFRALIQRQREEVGTDLDRFCTQCHSAIGTRSGELAPGFDFATLSDVTAQGVTCESCHRITRVVRVANAGHVLDPNAPVQGPFAAPASAHEAAQNPWFESSALCGSCHDVDARGLALESPYAEWLESPAAAEGRTCQDCHMPSYQGRAAVGAAGLERVLHRHTFTGVDVPLELPEGDTRKRLEGQSNELLQGAVSLSILPIAHPLVETRLQLDLIVTNRVDGHRVPSGSSFFRQCWLALEVRDADGMLLYESGQLDERGDLYDALHPEAAHSDPALQTFSARLLDAHGAPVLFPFQAAAREDHSLQPLEHRRLHYDVTLPSATKSPLKVTASVRFRALPPRLLRELGLASLTDKLRVLDMATTHGLVPAAEPPSLASERDEPHLLEAASPQAAPVPPFD